MKILHIGYKGALGSIVHNNLSLDKNLEIITASRSSGDYFVDITSENSIRELFNQVGKIDAIVVTAGETAFKSLSELTPTDNNKSIESKLKGQLNIVLIGKEYVNDNGSITLTTGIIGDQIIPMGSSSAMVNGALKAFVESSSFELNRGVRINAVSPGPLLSTWDVYKDYFVGFSPVEDYAVANAYKKAIFGVITGKVIKVY